VDDVVIHTKLGTMKFPNFEEVSWEAVFQIRIRMFLGLPDPHPDELFTSTDPSI
jgi:hypothetical protein